MENMQKSAEQQEPEWEPIEDMPPKWELWERAIPPTILIVGILMIFVMIADILFFYIGSREDHMALGIGGTFCIWAWWIATKVGN